MSSVIFPSDGTRPIHFWKAERETLRLLYRTPAAELIQTFYRQIHADCESLWGVWNECVARLPSSLSRLPSFAPSAESSSFDTGHKALCPVS
eukprot:COSAG02_NODE_7356_length_3048_cov_8.873177_1_plen_91_part_10